MLAIYKFIKIILILVAIIAVVWGFSDSYSSHTIDNIVHVVAIGIDKCDDEQENNMKVSFQFVNMSSGSEGSSGGEASTVVTSINTTTINKAINLMNSYIGKELNFSHCKVIVFSEDFAKEGISTEICTLVNNEEIRPSTNIVVSTSDANTYLKNANPNIEKLVTNYYDTFELTSNFTGYSDDATIGEFYNKLFNPSSANTAILGRTFKKTSTSDSSSESGGQGISQGGSQGGSSEGGGSQGTGEGGSSEGSSSQGQSEEKYSSENGESGKSTGGNANQNDSGGASLEISGERGTQNVGIAVFKDDKYVGQLSELDSICHLLITNNVDSFVLSIPMENYPDTLLDLNLSSVRGSKISVDTSSDSPNISVSVYCDAKILTIDKNSNYMDSEILKDISNRAQDYLKQQIETYLSKTSKEFKADITNFSNHALIKFLTVDDWENYDWTSKYENANFIVNVDIDVTSSLLFSGDQ